MNRELQLKLELAATETKIIALREEISLVQSQIAKNQQIIDQTISQMSEIEKEIITDRLIIGLINQMGDDNFLKFLLQKEGELKSHYDRKQS